MASPRRYASTGAAAVANPRTVIVINGTTAVRPALYDLNIGFASPADNSIEWIVQRITAEGTDTTVTPQPIDSGDPACATTSGENSTIEPTKTAGAELLDEELNQRASYRWVAAPGGEILCPASTNGLAAICIHASATPTARITLHFAE
jgi:hypothetical protein